MILASAESIREWTDKGIWGKKTLVDYFKENVAKTPDAVALADPPNKEALIGAQAGAAHLPGDRPGSRRRPPRP